MASFTRGITFATNGTVTAENLHNLIDQTTPRAGIITDRSVLTTMSTGDQVLIADTDDATNAYFITAGSLVGQALSGATYGGASFTAGTIATFNSTTGTVTNLTSSTATISTLAGNTTGGTFSGNIVATAGTVTTLTASTLTGALSGGTYSGNIIATVGTFSGLLNSSTGTFSGAINSTIGTIGTLNSTTGTIGNFTTTLAGDFTISNGTGTLGTTGVTAGTYGTSTIIPQITVDAKGRITSVGTSALGSTGKILQVLQSAKTDGFTTSSTTFVDVSGLSVSITPSSASNYILVFADVSIGGTNSHYSVLQLVRGSTQIYKGTEAGYTNYATKAFYPVSASASSGIEGSMIMFLDSPATTSSVTYKIQMRVSGNTGAINRLAADTSYNFASSITVMEVAA